MNIFRKKSLFHERAVLIGEEFRKYFSQRSRSYIWLVIFWLVIILISNVTINSKHPIIVKLLSIIIIPAVSVTACDLGRYVASQHKDAVREITGIFSWAFCVMFALTIYLFSHGFFDEKGNPIGTIATYYLKIIVAEMNIGEGFEISVAILAVTFCCQALTQFLCWAFRIRPEEIGGAQKTHICFGVYLWKRSVEPENDDCLTGNASIPEIWFSVDPVKLFAVLVMKCFCAATAASLASGIAVIAVFPKLAREEHLSLLTVLYFSSILGMCTLASIYLNEETAGWKEKLSKRIGAYFSALRK